MLPKTLSEFFHASIHLVFAVVSAEGFVVARSIYVPIENLYNFDGITSAIALIFAYFFLVTSWIGYYKSVDTYPHTETKKGIARYGFGLLVTFLIYYMLSLTHVDNKTKYGEIFWLLPVFFAILIIIHYIKSKEYKKELKKIDRENFEDIMVLTAAFFTIFLILAVVHHFLYDNLVFKIGDISITQIIFIFLAICFTFWYRWSSWVKYRHRRRRIRQKSSR